jgi:hypothetical protein
MPEKQPKKRCFVIMPFSETTPEHTEAYWTEHFEVFLKPLIEEHPELGVHRSEPIRTDIVKQIISDLLTCDVVVADLTDYNPNVFWELGIRQSFKSGTITIAQNNTRLPFDIDKKGTQFYYPNNHTKMEHFRKNFKEAIMDCLDHPEKCDSPILESVTGRGTIFQMFQHDETVRRLEALLSECDSNIKLFNSYIEKSTENQKLISRKEARFYTQRLRTLALELLISNRYIEVPPTFYQIAEALHSNIIAINEQLSTWKIDSENIEKWILGEELRWNSYIEFRKVIKDSYDKTASK